MPIKEIATKKKIIKKDLSIKRESTAFFSRIRWGESYVSLLLGAFVVVIAAFLGFFYVKVHQPKQELLPPATISRDIKLTISLPEASPSVSVVSLTKPNQPTKKQIFPSKPFIQSKNQETNQKHVYLVQKGDTLWSIAEKEYGSGYQWIMIAKANNLTNPSVVFSGNTLVIPAVTPILTRHILTVSPSPTLSVVITPTIIKKLVPTVQPSFDPNISITESEYTIKKGDTLWSIAEKEYGSGYQWIMIAKANNLTNPGTIFSGNVLKIPRTKKL